MDFGDAIKALKVGKRVCRSGWNGRGMWLFLVPETMIGLREHHRPFISMKDAQESYVPWLASQTDVLAEDWNIVE